MPGKKVETISTGSLAAALGISRQRVNELARKGKIPREADGKWNLEKVQKALGRNLDIHQKAPSLGQGPQAPPPGRRGGRSVTMPQSDDDADPGQVSLAEAQLKHELAKTAKTELEVDRLKGILINAQEAAHVWGEMIVAARNRALLIPSKVAPKVAVVSDVLICQEILDRELRSFLTELSEYRPNA